MRHYAALQAKFCPNLQLADCPGTEVEVAEGVPVYPLDAHYLSGYPNTALNDPGPYAQSLDAPHSAPLSNPVLVSNPFRVCVPEDPCPDLQQLLHKTSQALHNARTEGFEATAWQTQQQRLEPMQVLSTSHCVCSALAPAFEAVHVCVCIHQGQDVWCLACCYVLAVLQRPSLSCVSVLFRSCHPAHKLV